MRTKHPDGISSCCGKGIFIISDDTEGTCYYECEKCGDACDDKSWRIAQNKESV